MTWRVLRIFEHYNGIIFSGTLGTFELLMHTPPVRRTNFLLKCTTYMNL